MQSTMNAVYLLWPPAKPYLYGRLNPVNHHWIERFWIGYKNSYYIAIG